MDLTLLEAWCNAWKLRLNQSKSTHLRLSFSNCTNSPQNCHYNIAGAQLQSIRSQKDLGVVISNTLSWQQHYTKLCQKAYNALHLIKRTEKTIVHLTGQVPLLFLLLGVETQVRERYSNAGKNAKKGNEIHPEYSMDYKSRLTSLHLLSISLWLDLHDLLFLVKCLQDPDDNIEINRFITFRRTCTPAGSTGRMLTIKLVYTSATRHFYFNCIAMLWNVVQSSTNLSVIESLSTVKLNVD